MRLTGDGLRPCGSGAKSSPRRTRQLDATYRVLREASDHPTAEQILRRVRSALPGVSRGTVYRNLSKLVGEGRVLLVPVARAARYDARLDPHDHFVCRRCGAVLDVPLGTRKESGPPTLAGHVVEAIERTYHGSCRACAAAPEAEEGRA